MKHVVTAHDGSHTAIKLPRQLVLGCKIHKLSESFSHKKELDKLRNLHIYCTDDNGDIIRTIRGAIKRVSTKGVRKWALFVESIEDDTFDVGKLTRI